MSKNTRRAELTHKRQIRENACSLSIDTIGRHNLFVEPGCDRPKYFDLLERCDCADGSHRKKASAKRDGLLLQMPVRHPARHSRMRAVRGRFRCDEEATLGLLPEAFRGQSRRPADRTVLREVQDDETFGSALSEVRRLLLRRGGQWLRFRALCPGCVAKGYTLEL